MTKPITDAEIEATTPRQANKAALWLVRNVPHLRLDLSYHAWWPPGEVYRLFRRLRERAREQP